MRLPILAALTCLALPLTAQERPNTILVLDASGSMWGQIDGINKVVIARDVVADILADFPADENLGLTVYGHRTRGDCTDIETLIEAAPGTAGAIIDAVNTINPRGMTPMTDSVIAAAEALRYTEQAATVILVSDGIETCNPDPCAAARALEEAGIAFTAHVVGFDVNEEPEALAQMQCIAAETGGQFLTAANAQELNLAMEAVMAAEAAPAPEPEPEPEPAPPAEPEVVLLPVVFSARTELGTPVDEAIEWRISTADGPVSADVQVSGYETDLEPAAYLLTAVRPSDGAVVEVAFMVTGTGQTVEAVFPEALPEASLTAPDSAAAGTDLQVQWTGPDDGFDTIQIALPGEAGAISYAYTADGNPATLVLPAEPGSYELRYQWQDSRTIATRPITVTEAPVVLSAPDSAPGGSQIAVTWKGPNQESDNIQIATLDGAYLDYAYTSTGNPLTLVMPWQPGTYQLRYQFQDRETILTRPITITPGEVGLTAPGKAAVGSVIEIGWIGPDAPFDNIQIGGNDGSYTDYAYTSEGNPVRLTLPSTPGEYELRYQFRDRETIHRQTISVTPVDLALTAQPVAGVAETVPVTWTGPGSEGDFLGVGVAGEGGYLTYEYVNRGNPVEVVMPTAPGDYEIRYFAANGLDPLVAIPISVVPVEASLTVAEPARPGATIDVAWTAAFDPARYPAAFIGIGRPGEPYLSYEYLNRGNPLTLTLPEEPGSYELRLYLGRDDIFVGATPLEVRGK